MKKASRSFQRRTGFPRIFPAPAPNKEETLPPPSRPRAALTWLAGGGGRIGFAPSPQSGSGSGLRAGTGLRTGRLRCGEPGLAGRRGLGPLLRVPRRRRGAGTLGWARGSEALGGSRERGQLES